MRILIFIAILSIGLSANVHTRYNKIKDVIDKSTKKYNVPKNRIIQMLYHESKFNHKARSHTNVRGIAQITRATAKRYKIDISNINKSIYGMSKIMRDIFDNTSRKFSINDRWILSSFIYNRGKGSYFKAKKRLKRKGIKFTFNNIKKELAKRKYNKEGLDYIMKIKRNDFIPKMNRKIENCRFWDWVRKF